jgi:hypothetical protein
VENGDLMVRVHDPIIDCALALETDLLVLAAAMEPNDVGDLVTLYRCAVNPDGFLNEAHPKLRPVDMAVDGLFVAGIGRLSQTHHESIAQAKAAASRAGVVLSRKRDASGCHQILCHRKLRRMRPLSGCLPLSGHLPDPGHGKRPAASNALKRKKPCARGAGFARPPARKKASWCTGSPRPSCGPRCCGPGSAQLIFLLIPWQGDQDHDPKL